MIPSESQVIPTGSRCDSKRVTEEEKRTLPYVSPLFGFIGLIDTALKRTN